MTVKSSDNTKPATDGQAPNTGDDNGAGAEGSRGDVSVALRQERAKRRLLERKVAEMTAAGGNKPEDQLDLSKFGLTADDLDTSDTAAINKKIQDGIAAGIAHVEQRLASRLDASATTTELDAILQRYSIFQDPDKQLTADALTAATAALEALPASSTLQDVEEAIKQTAKRYSAYKAQRAAADQGGGQGADHNASKGPLEAGAAGAGAAAHLNTESKPAGSMSEVRQRARARAAAFLLGKKG